MGCHGRAGSMLETRVLQLLKKLESAAAGRGGAARGQQQLKPGRAGTGPGRGAHAAAPTKARSARGPAAAPFAAAAARDTAGEDYDKPSTSGRDK